jgi:hypothetical protein
MEEPGSDDGARLVARGIPSSRRTQTPGRVAVAAACAAAAAAVERWLLGRFAPQLRGPRSALPISMRLHPTIPEAPRIQLTLPNPAAGLGIQPHSLAEPSAQAAHPGDRRPTLHQPRVTR